MQDPLLTDCRGERLYQERLAQPDAAQIEALQAMDWTSHNVPLGGGATTFAGREHTRIDSEPRTRTIVETLGRMAARDSSLAGRRVLDLGCLEGGLSLEMARRDADVVGVEGRGSNVDKCLALKNYFGFDNLDFWNLDVRKLDPEQHGHFDIVLCCGLLYHLSEPFLFLRQLRRLVRDDGLLFVDTHVAPPDDGAMQSCRLADKLSHAEVLPSGGVDYEGRWFDEFATELGADHPWDAVNNSKSFWPTHEALRRGIYHSGFDFLVDIFGTFEPDHEMQLRQEYSRVYMAAAKRRMGL